jgi:hypothetical protein
LSALAMVPAERWLGLDRPNSRFGEIAGLVEVGAIGLVVLGSALGLLFFKELRRRGTRGRGNGQNGSTGTEVTLRVSPQNETNEVAPEEAQREGV